jgi:hypothetical protein
MATVQEKPLEEAETRVFEAPHQRVAAAALDSLRDMRLDVTKIDEEPERFVVLFVRPMSGIQWGAVGRMVIEKSPAGTGPTSVYINYSQRMPLSGGGQERWARAIFSRIENRLIPLTPPAIPQG